MRSGTTFEPGKVVLVPFPFTDLTLTRRRPVLVLSTAEHNRASRDFVCCGMTSKLSNRRNSVLVDPSEMSEGRLAVKSRIKYDKLFALEKSLLVKPLGGSTTGSSERRRRGWRRCSAGTRPLQGRNLPPTRPGARVSPVHEELAHRVAHEERNGMIAIMTFYPVTRKRHGL